MTFRDLNLTTPLFQALDEGGFEVPTPIQQHAFSVIMSGKDVEGIAQTGTGKTIAYLLPLIRMMQYAKNRHPQLMVVVPTRELAVQVTETASMLCKYLTLEPAAVFGGTNLRVQAAEIASGCDIVVGTPGRLLDLIYHGALNVRYIRKLVIDEVDEMLALGFRPQLERLFDLLPEKRQNILVSATISEDVEFILGDYFNAPERVEAAPPGTPLSKIRQGLFRVPNFNTKINLLGMLLEQQKEMERVLIFVSTKALADDLFQKLIEMQPGKIGVIHSNKDQNTRFLAVRKFKEGEIRILIATDIIARGIDITDVSHVINFDLPDEPQQYIHRIGRTGRADKEGVAYSLVGDQDIEKLPEIEAMMHYSVPSLPLPDNLVFSDVLTEAEIPRIHMKNLLGKVPELRDTKRAFHDRKDKNKKTNIKVSHKEKMQAKYGKPKTRGQKRK